ncbi:retrovirus-related pol polyprotein from transposon TNT 1-94 [Tanacetum coccineum]
MAASYPDCLMSKATSTKSWLWHRRLSHLNFGTINHLTKQDLVDGLLRFKYDKDHLCSACEEWKSKKAIFPPKLVPSTNSKLELIHIDLYGPIRVETINGKRYILVIVDDYSRYTWVYFLCIKDEAPEMIIKFINQIQRNMKVQILKVQSDNGTEIKIEKLSSLCYPINDRDDLRKIKPKAEIGIFIGYFESSKGFRISNRRTRKIMETIHVKFNELKAMASECNNSGFGLNCLNFQDSSEELNDIPSKEYLDNLFGPLHEEYYETRTPEVSENSAASTLNNEDTPSSSSIIVEDLEAPRLISSSEELIANEPSTLNSDNHSDEPVQEDVDLSNMHEFYQQHHFIDRLTKNHLIEQVIGDPSKSVTIRSRLHTGVEMCMYVLTVSTTEPTNIKEAMLDHSWIKSMQDEHNQFKILDVWELVERPVEWNVIKVKWLWKKKTDAKNTVIRNKSRLVTKGYSVQEGIDFE